MPFDAQHSADDPGPHALVARDQDGQPVVFPLPEDGARVTIGRASGNDVCVDWDEQVSRTHAQMERIGGTWTVVDDGISRNGTLINGERLTNRRRLEDGDVLRLGQTDLMFRAPRQVETAPTVLPAHVMPVAVSPAQRRVLVALARPYGAGSGYPVPASNQVVADELSISLEAVKGHLRALFGKFALGDLPQNQKRARLVESALQQGVISIHELTPQAGSSR